MGASTSFLGTVMSGAYISEGAGLELHCGNLFATSYVTIEAGLHVTLTNCFGTSTCSGSEFGRKRSMNPSHAVSHLCLTS